MLTIELNNQRLQQTLSQIEDAIGDLTPLMQAIAAELASQTEENFEHEGRPEWPELSDVTTERRAKQGHWPGQMLQVSAGGAGGINNNQCNRQLSDGRQQQTVCCNDAIRWRTGRFSATVG